MKTLEEGCREGLEENVWKLKVVRRKKERGQQEDGSRGKIALYVGRKKGVRWERIYSSQSSAAYSSGSRVGMMFPKYGVWESRKAVRSDPRYDQLGGNR